MERVVRSSEIENTVRELCLKANTELRPDVLEALRSVYDREKEGSISKKMLGALLANASVAAGEKLALCQDTGMVAVFIQMGGNVTVSGGNLLEAVNRGVEKAYVEGFFRKSVVDDPLIRKNTGTNTPAIIHLDIVEGDNIDISVMPKGFGSENKSRTAMLNPTCKAEEIADFCVETVKLAGPDACPPYILGIGVGGTLESCALAAKKALLRPITEKNPKPHVAELEKMIFEQANSLDIGVMGLGGHSTVMGVNVEFIPTHIAGCPVAVNMCCHSLRSASAVL